jgi:hypothetical protein
MSDKKTAIVTRARQDIAAGLLEGFVKIPDLDSRYKAVRSVTDSLAASMSAEDQLVQSCPEASPVKWHQAHTTEHYPVWF